jgi:hypothetical protein
MPIIRFFQLKLRYEHSMMLILHKTYGILVKNCCLNKLFEIFKICGHLATHNFVKINIITLNYAYYEVVQLTLRNEYPTTQIFHKT